MKQISFTATCSGSVDIYISVSWTPHLCSRDALITGIPNQFLWTNAEMPWLLVYQISFYGLMHIYITESDEPPHLSSIDALTTSTPNQFIWTNTHWDTGVRCTLYTALHSLQLYICCHFIYLVIWSWATGQVSHAFISIEHLCQFTAVVVLLIVFCCGCWCELHNNNKHKYQVNVH